ncbi:hypothetical protein ACFQ05_37970 [Amycolatopsis umgeniensis]|uniref:Uncharacterized protein n=1 Tax=Amycolatopsis umgeniensis TaxID=336628 RepID=A0A841AXU9_9PSEU|nr:hypothetical protein [Amycolatopsis umgeniensis]MBB5851215.1 hypothetical protein [Amycolatopsis umgeniensis]
MTGDEQVPKKRSTWKDDVAIGFLLGAVLVTPAAVAVSASIGDWLWTILAIPGTVAVAMVIGGLVRTRAAAALGSIGRKTGVASTFAVLGMILGAAAGVALIWFGISFNIDADICDPAQNTCVAVVNGVARGESTESVGGQRFKTFLLSLVAILPGAVLLVFVARAALARVRG